MYTVVLTPNELGGYTVSVPVLDAIVTQGDTVEEALAMAKDAIALYLDYLRDAHLPVPSEKPGVVVSTVQVAA